MKVQLERLINSCEEAMTNSVGKHEQLYSFPDKTADTDALKKELESWWSDVTLENDENWKRAREYIDGLPETEETSQSSVKAA